MSKKISRRDFLDGVAKGVGAAAIALSPLAHLSFAITKEGEMPELNVPYNYYPPAEMGLRGNVPSSIKTAHRLMRGDEPFDLPKKETISETYDLIVVGAGISGLAAAYFYRQKHPDNRILILDNSDDFGGHCARNEFTTSKGMMMTYAGSESLQSPRSIFSPVATDFMKELTVNIDTLEQAFDVNLYPDMGLSKAVYFDKKNWGENKIVAGDPGFEVADDIPRNKLNGRTYAEFIGDFPMNDADKKALIELFEERTDYLSDLSTEEKLEYLDSTSYEAFLRDKVKLSDTAIKFFTQQTTEFQGVGIDATPCVDARLCALPGFEAMKLPPMDEESEAELNDPYVFHFPDGNASIARLVVRKLIPEVAPGSDMNDIVLAKFDYSKLDVEGSKTRLRLNATAIHTENNDDQTTDLVYSLNDSLYRVRAKNIVMANYNNMIPYMVPSMPKAQRDALSENIRVPFVYAKVALKNWQVFKELGIHKLYAPTAPFCLTKLDYPVSIGGYEHSDTPDEPIILHMVHVPVLPGSGKTAREQSIEGRKKVIRLDFIDFEEMIREQLDNMFGQYGFDHEEMITGITVNRWGHGYSYCVNTLFDDEEEAEKIIETARQPFGRIHIANSDSEWDPYMHAAIDAAHRAVNEIDA